MEDEQTPLQTRLVEASNHGIDPEGKEQPERRGEVREGIRRNGEFEDPHNATPDSVCNQNWPQGAQDRALVPSQRKI